MTGYLIKIKIQDQSCSLSQTVHLIEISNISGETKSTLLTLTNNFTSNLTSEAMWSYP